MTEKHHGILEPESALLPSNKQKLFLRYFTAILVDLIVLNLFIEYSAKVVIDSFTVSIFVALLLQLLLKLTLALEHRVAAYYKAKEGILARIMRFFTAWLILFGSKFVILEAIDFAFGDSVSFLGRFNGLGILIVVIIAMLLAEELFVRFYRKLA